MNYYHVAYWIKSDRPTLSGLTIKGRSIVEAHELFLLEMNYEVSEDQIKYIIKLN